MIMATVNLAACKIAGILFGLERWQTLLGVGILNVVFAAHSGLWGVLVIDMIQFFIKMTAVIAAAWFALKAPQVGGLTGLIDKLSVIRGPGGIDYLAVLPDFTNNWDMAVAVFVMPIAVQWWAVWYPGAEPGGGSYIAQRMLASKSEKDALGAVLFFNVAHYVLRPWPWILVALCSILVYPELSDIQRAFPNLDPRLLGARHRLSRDAEVPAGRLRRPDGRRPDRRKLLDDPHAPELGRVVPRPRFLPALHPPRRRRAPLRDGRTDRHRRARSSARPLLVYLLDTAKQTFDLILQVGAGTGLLYLVRWFWWRVNAWCEVAAMISSFAISVALLVLAKNGVAISTHVALLITIAVTTICWVATAFLGPETDREVLVEFYRKVRPSGPRLGACPQGGRITAGDRGRRQHPAGAARLDCRVRVHLVRPLHRWQPALHAAKARPQCSSRSFSSSYADARQRCPASCGAASAASE